MYHIFNNIIYIITPVPVKNLLDLDLHYVPLTYCNVGLINPPTMVLLTI